MIHHYPIPSSFHSLTIITVCILILLTCQLIDSKPSVSVRVVLGWLVGVGLGLVKMIFEE
ncbi:hypothetical protein [Spirosoma aerolatum]|uniref:hypothetical protein n=1 Tax=Spirosoma aerolatum TaxID=1211326 RepID=UPI0009AC61D2|nr:hypothetical protein [Spirosoma aerolatum]